MHWNFVGNISGSCTDDDKWCKFSFCTSHHHHCCCCRVQFNSIHLCVARNCGHILCNNSCLKTSNSNPSFPSCFECRHAALHFQLSFCGFVFKVGEFQFNYTMVKMSIVEKNGNLSMQSLDRSIKINVAKSASLSAFSLCFPHMNLLTIKK